MGKYNSERAKERLLARIRHDKRKLRRNHRRKLFQYAAVVFILLGLGYGYHRISVPAQRVEQPIDFKNSITLKLSDGSIQIISDEESAPILGKSGQRVGLQKGGELIYQKAKTTGKPAYNTISVPYGKRFVLTLSDGTRAHLNAGTTLKYPVRFQQGRNREVFLTGEGHFEVTKDGTNPFFVNTDALNVKVLGTQFNVSAYPDDAYFSTVLVEGSVSLLDRSQGLNAPDEKILEPGHMASWQKQGKKMTIEEADTELYTGWMNGKIIFDHMPFREIRKKLERSYNVSIINEYEALEDLQFTASFDIETIEQVLAAFHKNHPMRYTIEGKKIRIEKP